jgi:hypothetical protein
VFTYVNMLSGNEFAAFCVPGVYARKRNLPFLIAHSCDFDQCSGGKAISVPA